MSSRLSRAQKLVPPFLVVAGAWACGEVEPGDIKNASAGSGSATASGGGGTMGVPVETAGNNFNPPFLVPGGTGGVPGTSGTTSGFGGTNPPGFGLCPPTAPPNDSVCTSSQTTCEYEEAGCSVSIACIGSATGQHWSIVSTTCAAGGAGGAPDSAGGAGGAGGAD
jgi:hypothetical protein